MFRSMAILIVAVSAQLLAQEPDPATFESEVRQNLQRSAAQLQEIEDALEETPSNIALWQQLAELTLEHRYLETALFSGQRNPPFWNSETALAAQLEVAQRFLDREPENPEAHLFQLQFIPSLEIREGLVTELIQRFPSDVGVNEAWFGLLRSRGDVQAATRAAQNLLETNRSSAAFRAAHELFIRTGQEDLAGGVLEAWLELFPSDPRALRLWLPKALRVDSSEQGSVAMEIVQRADKTFEAKAICDELNRRAGTLLESALQCYAALVSQDFPPHERVAVVTNYVQVLGLQSRWQEATAYLEELEPEHQQSAMRNLARKLTTAQRCQEALPLLTSLVRTESTAPLFASVNASAIESCWNHPEVQQHLLQLPLQYGPEVIESLLVARAEPLPRALELLAIERLQQDPGSQTLWRAVDLILKRSGAQEGRIQHLRAFLTAHPKPERGDSAYQDLFELLLSSGEIEEAIAWLEKAQTQFAASRENTLRLVDLYVQLDRPAEAAQVLQRYVAQIEGDGGGEVLLMQAQLHKALGEPDLALDAYRQYLQAADENVRINAISEFAELLPEGSGDAELVSILTKVHENRSERGWRSEGLHRFLAEQLATIGRAEAALFHLERTFETAPEDTELQQLRLDLYEQLGDWQVIEQRLLSQVRNAPEDSRAWNQWVRYLLRRGRSEEAIEAAKNALRSSNDLPTFMVLLVANHYRQEGETLSAIRLLQAAKEKHPDDSRIVNLLRQLYRQLALAHSQVK